MRKFIVNLKAEHGAALVEFALTFPFLVFLIMGAFDLGWAVYINNSVSIAAREGARRGIILNAPTTGAGSICDRARTGLQSLGTLNCNVQDAAPDPNTPGIYIRPVTRHTGQPVMVTIQYRYRPITPFFSPFVPSGIILSSTSTMIVE